MLKLIFTDLSNNHFSVSSRLNAQGQALTEVSKVYGSPTFTTCYHGYPTGSQLLCTYTPKPGHFSHYPLVGTSSGGMTFIHDSHIIQDDGISTERFLLRL